MLVPGVGWGLALWRPREVSVATRLAVALPFGYATVGAVAFVLAAGHMLFALPFFITLASLTALGWYVGLRRASPADHIRQARAEFREDAWSLWVGLGVLVAIAVLRLAFTSWHSVSAPVSFRYWADALEVADSHRIPRSTLQWGAIYSPTTNKVFLNSFNAAMTFVLGREALRALPPLLWIGSVGLAATIWSLGREFGMRLTAPLLPILLLCNRLFLNTEMTRDMDAYRAETYGRLIAFGGLILAIRAVRDRDRWREAIIAGVLLGIAVTTHLVPVVVALVIFGWYCIGTAGLSRRFKAIFARAITVGGVAAVIGIAGLVVARGDVGFGGAAGNRAYSQFAGRFDPTIFLATGSAEKAAVPPPRGAWYYAPGYLLDFFVGKAIGAEAPRAVSMAVAGAAAVLALVIWRISPRELRPLGFVAWATGASLLAVALFFSRRYDVFILARFGIRRMTDYASIPLVLIGAVILEAALLKAWRSSRIVPNLAAVFLAALAAVAVLPSARADAGVVLRGQRVLAPLRWAGVSTPCSARILANRRTIGTFEALIGRAGILEGMAPYLRPAMLSRVVDLIAAAEDFFRDPARGRDFVARQGVDYVLWVDQTVPLGHLGPALDGTRQRLERLPFLVSVYRSKHSEIFKVVGVQLRDTVDPSGRPGYRCGTGTGAFSR